MTAGLVSDQFQAFWGLHSFIPISLEQLTKDGKEDSSLLSLDHWPAFMLLLKNWPLPFQNFSLNPLIQYLLSDPLAFFTISLKSF